MDNDAVDVNPYDCQDSCSLGSDAAQPRNIHLADTGFIPETILDYITQAVAAEWLRFGRFLQLDEAILETLDLDHPNVHEKCRACVTKFKQSRGGICWVDLKVVLQKMQRLDVINSVEKQYNTVATAVRNNSKLSRIDKAVAALKNHYEEKYSEVMRCSGMDDSFTSFTTGENACVELAVVTTEQVDKVWNIRHDREFYMKESCMQTKSIQPEDLFCEKEKLICLSGVAGCGKSTLLSYLTLQWARGNIFKRFQFVFTILCRELNLQNHVKSLEDLLKHGFPFVFEQVSYCDIQKYADLTLFLVDGLDEYLHLNELVNLVPIGLQCSKTSHVLYQMLNSWEPTLPGHSVLSAGRPESSSCIINCFKSTVEVKCIQVLGFNSQNIDLYIQNRFSNQLSVYEKVKKDIFNSESLYALARLPVYLSILCTLLGTENDTNIKTMTETLAWSLGLFLRKHFHSKSVNLINVPLKSLFKKAEVVVAINVVLEVAYNTLKEGKVLFDADALAFEIESLEYCGLIMKVHVGEFDTMIQFGHLCFQEFCAAACIVKNNINRLMVKENVFLRGCLPIIASLEGALLVKTSSHPIIKAFVNSLNVSQLPDVGMLSLVGHDVFDIEEQVIVLDTTNHNTMLFFILLDEFQNEFPEDLDRLIAKKSIEIEINHYAHTTLNSVLHFIDCISKTYPRNITKLNFFGTLSVLPHESFVKFSKYFLNIRTVLVKQHTELLPTSFVVFRNCVEQSLASNDPISLNCLHLNACGALQDAHLKELHNLFPFLQELDISYNQTITADGFTYLCSSIQRPQMICLQRLNLSSCNLSKDKIAILIPVFLRLTELQLSYNQNISLAGWQCLAEAFSEKQICCLQKLELMQCSLSDAVIQVMAPIFTTLSDINISLNRNITLNGWTSFSKSCKSNANLRRLDLYACNITDEIVMELAPVFYQLQALQLDWNRKITSVGWKYVVEELLVHKSSVRLKVLNVKGCKIKDEDFKIFSEILLITDEINFTLDGQSWKEFDESFFPEVMEENPWF